MLNIQDIRNMDLLFVGNIEERYIKDALCALVITQKYIDEEYNKLWIDNIEINYEFVKLINEMNGINVIEYFKTINTYAPDKCLKMIYNNMEFYNEHSGFSMSWTIKNTQRIILYGIDNFRLRWLEDN
jgi:hypothetical protein